MKQSELETLVDHLARAEEEAAAAISDEQTASTARLKQLQEDLQVQFDDAVAVLLQEQTADHARQEQQDEELNRQADQQVKQQITVMQERHDQHMDSIVNWAVKRIIEP